MQAVEACLCYPRRALGSLHICGRLFTDRMGALSWKMLSFSVIIQTQEEGVCLDLVRSVASYPVVLLCQLSGVPSAGVPPSSLMKTFKAVSVYTEWI